MWYHAASNGSLGAMMDMRLFATQRASLLRGFEQAESNIGYNDSLRRRRGKVMCIYCERLGEVKKVYFSTKELLFEMLASIDDSTLPRLLFGRHLRKEFPQYQGYILPDGHYINLWPLGGHSWFTDICKGNQTRFIKVHAQRCSNIIFSNQETPPTAAQIQTVREIILDSDDPLWFSFHYEINHPSHESPF